MKEFCAVSFHRSTQHPLPVLRCGFRNHLWHFQRPPPTNEAETISSALCCIQRTLCLQHTHTHVEKRRHASSLWEPEVRAGRKSRNFCHQLTLEAKKIRGLNQLVRPRFSKHALRGLKIAYLHFYGSLFPLSKTRATVGHRGCVLLLTVYDEVMT